MAKILRLCRRLVLKNFGSYKKFLICMCIILTTMYLLKSMIQTPSLKEVKGEVENQNNTVTEQMSVGVCDINEECPAGRTRFYIMSGYQNDKPPRICFNGKDYVSRSTINGRGVNMVVVNELTMEVEDVQIFDTYVSGDGFHSYLLHNISDYRIILFATYDDASKELKKETRQLLTHFGSTKISILQFRDALVFVGQKGLTQGSAIEKFVRKFLNRDFAEPAEVTGCLMSAVGKLNHFVVEDGNVNKELAVNCGVTKDCGAEAFPAHLYSGFQNTEFPKMCINGKDIMENKVGRGLNVAVVNPETKEVVKSGHFDTYEYSNTSLDKFLESMKDGEIVLAVTYDEATMHLTSEVKNQFALLGSFYVNKLAMRDAWCFVGQKGLSGRSPYEELEFAPPGGMTWSDPVDRRFCIPKLLKGFTLMPGDIERNQKRLQFCSQYVGFGEFCAGGRNEEFIHPAALLDDMLIGHRIFSIPILVVPGANKNAFRMQLESLISNPGIKQKMVSVYYSDKYNEYEKLIELFSFKPFPVAVSGGNYSDLLRIALEKIWSEHSDSKYVMVFEEEVMARKHYLSFMAQCLDAVEADDSLIGVTGWNENGYVGASDIPNIVYRAETFPGLGFLLKRSFYDRYMKNKLSCCRNRSWEGWLKGELNGLEMLVPDTSFVTRRPLEETTQPEFLLHLFNRQRVHQRRDPLIMRNKDQLTKDKYEESLIKTLKTSIPLKIANISACNSNMIPGVFTDKSFTVFYEQKNRDDETILRQLCRCFKLFSLENHDVRGKHHGIIRFSSNGNHVFLVGSRTPYYIYKPSNYPALSAQ